MAPSFVSDITQSTISNTQSELSELAGPFGGLVAGLLNGGVKMDNRMRTRILEAGERAFCERGFFGVAQMDHRLILARDFFK